MFVSQRYSHKGAQSLIDPALVANIELSLQQINPGKNKVSKEAKRSSLLYSPVELNDSIKSALGLNKSRLSLTTPDGTHTGFQELDGVLGNVGIEVQFGKYAFMGYDILTKFPIFKSRGIIDYGIEIVPTKYLAKQMSTGVSYFEQISSVLHNRGVADLDVPTLILGIQ